MKMNRLGLIAPSELEGEAKALYDAFYILVEKSFRLTPKQGPIPTHPAQPYHSTNTIHGPHNLKVLTHPTPAQQSKSSTPKTASWPPPSVFPHTPALSQAILTFITTMGQLPDLSRPNREIAIPTVSGKFNAAYEVYAHAILAQKAGLTAEQIAQIQAGEKPATLDEEGSAVYDVAWELVNVPGPLKERGWEKAVGLIGKEGTTAVVHYVEMYV